MSLCKTFCFEVSNMYQTLPKMLKDVSEKNPDTSAQYYKNAKSEFLQISFKELYQIALDFGAGLLSMGVNREDHIGIIADNRKEWQQTSMGIMAIGAIDVPRGCDATEKDLAYILSFAECKIVVAENSAQVIKISNLKDSIPTLQTLITYDEPSESAIDSAKNAGIELLNYAEVLEKGKTYRTANPNKVEEEVEKGKPEDLACIIFTSGTTGEPKGVMLQHSNFIAQFEDLQHRIPLNVGDKGICVLPIWHAFQRICEYIMLLQGTALCYSKPIGSILLSDFVKLNPQIIPAVPRVFEAIYDGIYRTMRKTGGITYALFQFFVGVGVLHSKMDRKMFRKEARFGNDHIVLTWILFFLPWLILSPLKALGSKLVFSKIRAKLGNAFQVGVSGGGALPPAIDNFFWAIGVNLIEGYGLTETAPVVAVRPVKKPIFGTVGSAIKGVEVRIIDDEGNPLPAGKKGDVQVRGGIVMRGYYNRDDLTEKVIDKNGWFSTGDIGMLTVDNEIVLKGRKKDTIVLRGGENVEPLPIEMKINESRYVSQSVVVGQDERYLGVLIVPAQDELVAYAKENSISYSKYEDLLKNSEIEKLFDTEIQSLVNSKNGFKMFERISKFVLLPKAFEVGVELSAKQEIMRYRLNDIYEKEIKSLFN